MTQIKPFPRNFRTFHARSEALNLNADQYYYFHHGYAQDPRHYIRAFLLIQEDILDLFSYIEPADKNSETYSHQIQQLLTRCCIEIEANFTAILTENGYRRADGNLNMRDDYYKIENSHKLSAYEIKIPDWKGNKRVRRPFQNWQTSHKLSWYQIYNKAKHNRHNEFEKVTLDILMDAVCGLVALLTSQFNSNDYSSRVTIWGSGNHSYEGSDGMSRTIGDRFLYKFNHTWPEAEQYDFVWDVLKDYPNPFTGFIY